jgi:predicted dehydrogenase
MIRVGIAGIGFMGWIHYLAYQKVRGVKLVAVAEPNAKRLAGDWRDIKGNFGPPGEMVDLSPSPAIRTIVRCSPIRTWIWWISACRPRCIPEAVVAAANSGKHVFCEKPMALTTADCRRMVEATGRNGKLLFIGHVLPFVPEYAHALKIVREGKYGRLLGGSFKRVISDPLWLKDFYDPRGCGGPMLDLHIHDAHFIRLLFGQPKAVTSRGRMRGMWSSTSIRFSTSKTRHLVVSATSGVVNQQGRTFTHGFEIQLEKATLNYELGVYADGLEVMPLKVLPANGRVVRPKLPGTDMTDSFVDEIKEVIKCVQAGQPSAILDGDLARDAVVLGHKQTESVLKAKTIKV